MHTIFAFLLVENILAVIAVLVVALMFVCHVISRRRPRPPRRVLGIALAVGAMLLQSGCATPWGKAVSERVDLGDGMIFDLIPVSTAATAANAAQPGAGALITAIEARLKGDRDAKLGPFGGLPYTSQRQVVLKTGVIIQESEIERLIEVLTPIVPAPVVRMIQPAQLTTQPVSVSTNAPPAPAPTPGPVVTDPEDQGTTGVLDPAIEAALRKKHESND